MQAFFYTQKEKNNVSYNLTREKTLLMTIKTVALALVSLFLMHALLSFSYTGDLLVNVQKGRYKYVDFYVFTPEAYKIFSTGQKEMASSLLMLYSFYAYANINIPSINFERLNSALTSVTALDDRNLQPYLTTTFYWLWAKKKESRLAMAKFLLTGLDRFQNSWEIPYALYRIYGDLEESGLALKYATIAAFRSVNNDGPAWIVDMPAVLKKREGKSSPADNIKDALRWVQEIRAKTNEQATDEKYRKNLDEREIELLWELYDISQEALTEMAAELYNVDLRGQDLKAFLTSLSESER